MRFSFRLAATLALIVVFDGSGRMGDRSWIMSLVLSVVAAQLATLPILAAAIGTVNGIGLIANLVDRSAGLAGISDGGGWRPDWAGESTAIGEMIVLPAGDLGVGMR